MNNKTLVIKAAECAVKEMMINQSVGCLVAEGIDINHAKMNNISWEDVLIGLRELESEEEE